MFPVDVPTAPESEQSGLCTRPRRRTQNLNTSIPSCIVPTPIPHHPVYYSPNNSDRPANASTKSLTPAHHTFFPLRFFISACFTIACTGTHSNALPWIVITAALSSGATLTRPGCACSRAWWSSKKDIQRRERRVARARSMGEGTPPWRVCPRAAERESKRAPPSSLSILVMTSVV